jgi:hypothetical protein
LYLGKFAKSSKSKKAVDVFKHQRIFFPIEEGSGHFIFIEADLGLKRMISFDSLNRGETFSFGVRLRYICHIFSFFTDHSETSNQILRHMKVLSISQLQKPLQELFTHLEEPWTFEIGNCPPQGENGTESGAMMAINLTLRAFNAEITAECYTLDDTRWFRNFMGAVCMRGRLHP